MTKEQYGYNGWRNRETWLINIHFNPETKSDIEFIKEQVEEMKSGLNIFLQDMIDFECIDWEELEEYLD